MVLSILGGVYVLCYAAVLNPEVVLIKSGPKSAVCGKNSPPF